MLLITLTNRSNATLCGVLTDVTVCFLKQLSVYVITQVQVKFTYRKKRQVYVCPVFIFTKYYCGVRSGQNGQSM
jgi:hypothetical protein